ncbi:MAG: DUF5060 domain-containing protein [Anaerolineae bacterium]|nr:DUF5060 domain-containing protein [Anaerolineae bacterium]
MDIIRREPNRRMRYRSILLLLMVGALLCGEWSLAFAQGPEATPAAAPAATSVTVYERMEWTVPLEVEADNPFDPAEIEVLGVFTGPDGSQVTMPGFWMQPMAQTCVGDCAIEVLEPQGAPEWRIRFAPTRAGSWQYDFQVRRNSGSPTSVQTGSFEVAEGEGRGFVRVSENGRYFAFDDQTPYFPVGHNLAWSWEGAGGVFGYQRWLRELAASGGNYARLFIDVPWFIGFEWEGSPGDYTAAQDDFWRLDAILETASELGIYLDVVVLWHQGLANYAGAPVLVPEQPARADTSADWSDNPYNVFNGGFLTSTTQFFTEQQARLMFRRRLYYMVARWGYSPNVMAWDLLSAADRVVGYNPTIVLPWLEEMTAYLRDIDPHDHLITIGSAEAPLELLDAPGIDFGQIRYFQRAPLEEPEDQVLHVVQRLDDALRQTTRPVLLTEFSLSPWYEPAEVDPGGRHVANTLWASMLAGAAGAGGSWWWDTYLVPNDLLEGLQPVAIFAQDIPWGQLRLSPVQVQMRSGDATEFGALTLDGYDRRLLTDDLPASGPIRVTPDGTFPRLDRVSAFLYGQTYNNQQHAAQVYEIVAPVDTRLTIAVGSVSRQAAARLVVRLDDVFVGEVALSPGSTDITLAIPLAAGEHRITLINEGDDWLQLAYLRLDAYIPPVRALALADVDSGLLLAWFQNRAFQWQNEADVLSPISGFEALVSDLPPGEYRVEYFATDSGDVLGEDRVTVAETGEQLVITLLPLRESLAVKVTHLE